MKFQKEILQKTLQGNPFQKSGQAIINISLDKNGDNFSMGQLVTKLMDKNSSNPRPYQCVGNKKEINVIDKRNVNDK